MKRNTPTPKQCAHAHTHAVCLFIMCTVIDALLTRGTHAVHTHIDVYITIVGVSIDFHFAGVHRMRILLPC